jgi:hypothetical protein
MANPNEFSIKLVKKNFDILKDHFLEIYFIESDNRTRS